MTGKLARSGMFEQTYVFPASGDDGASVGAAQYVYHHFLRQPPPASAGAHHESRPGFQRNQVAQALESHAGKLVFHRVDNVEDAVADALVDGKVVGWFQGRMEFGPRALGNRSILADPRTDEMRDVVNVRVKLQGGIQAICPGGPRRAERRLFRHVRRRCGPTSWNSSFRRESSALRMPKPLSILMARLEYRRSSAPKTNRFGK